jgi:hypothetical protein
MIHQLSNPHVNLLMLIYSTAVITKRRMSCLLKLSPQLVLIWHWNKMINARLLLVMMSEGLDY